MACSKSIRTISIGTNVYANITIQWQMYSQHLKICGYEPISRQEAYYFYVKRRRQWLATM